jgi:hypothetical protein
VSFVIFKQAIKKWYQDIRTSSKDCTPCTTLLLLLCCGLLSGQVVMAAAQVQLWQTALQQLAKLPTTKADPDQLVDTSHGHLDSALTFMELSKVNPSTFSKLVALKVGLYSSMALWLPVAVISS